MITLERLFKRADDEVLQALIGRESLRLLRAIDEDLTAPSRLRQIIIDLHGYEGLLTDKESRRYIFDLLLPKEAKRLASVLGIESEGETYQALRKSQFRKNSSRETTLFHFFNLDPPVRKEVHFEPASKNHSPNYALFAHQRTAARKIKPILDAVPRRVVLHMPTGSGKTRTAMNIISEHLRKTEPGFVIWLAYSEELCEQAATEFEKAWDNLGNRDVNVYRFWGGRELPLDSLQGGFMVAGLSKMYSLAKRRIAEIGQIGRHATLVIIDEAHQAIAETYKLVLDSLTVHSRKPGLLGLTATPGRTWLDIEQDRELADFFGRKKVILEVEGYDNPIDYLVDNEYLAQTEFKPLFVTPGLELTREDRIKLKDQLDIPNDVLRQLAADQERNTAILGRLEEMLEDHDRILYFGTTVEHAEVMATVLQSRGHVAAAITGETPTEQRKRHIEHFKQITDEPMVLCNYGVLTTGFDAPNTSAALIARPTKSLVLYSQMVGRAIRGPKAGGNSQAEIVTVIDRNLPGFASIAEAFTNWEDVWD